MELIVTSDERAQLELIALHAGKTPVQMLTQAAWFLLEHDVDSVNYMKGEPTRPSCQTFLPPDAMDARLARVCGTREVRSMSRSQ